MSLTKNGRCNFVRKSVDPSMICKGIEKTLESNGKSMDQAKILFIGVAYNADSGALEVMDSVSGKKANTAYYDPYRSNITTENGKKYNCVELTDKAIKESDCVVFTASHSCFKVDEIVEKAELVVDFRDATKFIPENKKITKL